MVLTNYVVLKFPHYFFKNLCKFLGINFPILINRPTMKFGRYIGLGLLLLVGTRAYYTHHVFFFIKTFFFSKMQLGLAIIKHILQQLES